MTSTTKINRSLCSICGKVPSLSFCTGCQRVFCTDHIEQHRNDLSNLFDKILDQHRQCKETLIKYTDESLNHPLMKQIHKWEIESIEKIHQVAIDARTQVLNAFHQFASNAILTMKDLTNQLTKAQDEETFLEHDLRQWMNSLIQMKKDLDKPPTINMRKSEQFLSKLVVDISEIFNQSAGRIAIKDEGKLLVNIGSNGYGTVRSQGEYSTGKHRFRFKIEQTTVQKWNLIGIVSKISSIQSTAFNTPTTYAWLANNFVCLNGKLHADYQGYKSDLEKNDILELIIDCHKQSIRLTNERTHSTHELMVDLKHCPFPWQIQVGLYYSRDRIRLLWK